MNNCPEYKIVSDDLEVELEIIPYKKTSDDVLKESIHNEIADIDNQLDKLRSDLEKENKDFDKLTNHADGFDYAVAVGSGVLCGLIDALFVGEFNFNRGKINSYIQVNHFITKFAKLNGYKGERLNEAIAFLENKFPVAQDSIYQGADIGVGAKNHHLADFAHHPTLLGLVASVLVQFFRLGILVNRDGEWNFKFISTEPKELLKIWLPVIISGIIMWMVHIAEGKYKDEIDEKIPKPIQKLIKALASAPLILSILRVSSNWAGHLVSDIGGSKNTAGGGMGIPGLFISLMHEISSLPLLNKTELPRIVNDLYTKEKWDMRSELAVFNELGRQAIPVLLGEVLVRTFYFVRRLIQECKEHDGKTEDINWRNVIPFKNRTIARMMTIENGTFVTIDLADAGIRAAIKSGGNGVAFLSQFIMRVNFVGIGRFAVAVYTDVKMGIERNKIRDARIKTINQMLHLSNAKVFYKQAEAYLELKDLDVAINECKNNLLKAMDYFNDSVKQDKKDFEVIDVGLKDIRKNNPDLAKRMLKELDGGF